MFDIIGQYLEQFDKTQYAGTIKYANICTLLLLIHFQPSEMYFDLQL